MFGDDVDNPALHLNLKHEFSSNTTISWGLDTFFAHQNLPYDQINAFTASGLNSYVVRDDDLERKLSWFGSFLKLETKVTERLKTVFQIAGNYLIETLSNSNAGDTAVDELGAPLTPNSQYYRAHSYRIYADLLNQYQIFHNDAVQDDFQVGINFITDHLDFINNSFDGDVGAGLPSTDGYPGLGEKAGRQNYALYFQNLFHLKNFTFTSGARVDHNTTFGNEWSPRVAASYTFDKTDTTLKASYSEGFHAPTIPEFFDATIGGTVTALALKRKAETTHNYEVSVEQNLFDKKLKLRSTYFYTSYNKLLDIVEAINKANSWGIENDIFTSLIPQTKVGLNYTYNHTHNDDTGNELTLRPQHMLNAYVEVEPFEHFTIRPQLEYVSRRKNPETVSLTIGDFPVQFYNSNLQTSRYVEGHTALHLLLNYEWEKPTKNIKKIDLYAKGTNLTNSHYENTFGYPVSGFRVTAGSNFSF